MFDEFLTSVVDWLEAFSTAQATLGLVGFLLFTVCLFIITRVPSALRQIRTYWLVELILFPLLVIGAATLINFVLDQFGAGREAGTTDFISAVALVLTSAYLLDRAVKLFFWRGILRHRTTAIPEIVRTLVSAVIFIGGAYVIIAFVYARPVTGLVVSSGVLLGVIGLAFQPVLGDIIAGVSLTIHRPFVVGDWIELEDGAMGTVISTDWRATRIQTRNNTVHIVPNGRLSHAAIHNFDQPEHAYAFWFFVPVAGSVPPKLVVQLLLEAAIKSPSVLDKPAPVARIWDAEELPVRYMITVHCENYFAHFNAKSEVLDNAWQLFDHAGFSFAARTMEAELRRGEVARGDEPRAEDILNEIKLLSPLTETERRALIDESQIHVFGADESIVIQDRPGASAFIILAGMVRVHLTHEKDRSRDIELARLGTFDFFGEMSLLTGAPRAANVTAITDCRLLEIPKPCLEPVLQHRPELADELAELMAERKMRLEMLSSGPDQKSMGTVLNEYREAFTGTIRGFFKLDGEE